MGEGWGALPVLVVLLSSSHPPFFPSPLFPARRSRNCDHFVAVSPDASNAEIAKLIAGAGVHVVVDLNGFTAGNAIAALAYRPAPILINFLGFPGMLARCTLAVFVQLPPGACTASVGLHAILCVITGIPTRLGGRHNGSPIL